MHAWLQQGYYIPMDTRGPYNITISAHTLQVLQSVSYSCSNLLLKILVVIGQDSYNNITALVVHVPVYYSNNNNILMPNNHTEN